MPKSIYGIERVPSSHGLNLYTCRHCGSRFKSKGWKRNTVVSSCLRLTCLRKAKFTDKEIFVLRIGYKVKNHDEHYAYCKCHPEAIEALSQELRDATTTPPETEHKID